MKILILVSGVLVCAAAFAGDYYGPNSIQASLEFDSSVKFHAVREPTADESTSQIRDQLQYMIGPLHMGATGLFAAPLGGSEVTNVRVEPSRDESGLYVAQYHYRGTFIVEKSTQNRLTILLPVSTEKFWEHYGPRCTRGTEAGIPRLYWYSWAPLASTCPLREGKDYVKVRVPFQRLPSTAQTYPEYNRLADPEGRVVVDAFFGTNKIQDTSAPGTYDDFRGPFDQFRSTLWNYGYTNRVISRAEIRKLYPITETMFPFVEEFHKKLANGREMVVRAFFGNTALEGHAQVFHYMLKHALETSAMVFYNGHAGLGHNLNLDLIEQLEKFKIELPTDRYQILLFSGCLTYTYYVDQYLGRKKTAADPRGTKSLEVLNNGLESDAGSGAVPYLLRAIERWNRGETAGLSYQDIANHGDGRFLFGVSGDEDNPTTVPKL